MSLFYQKTFFIQMSWKGNIYMNQLTFGFIGLGLIGGSVAKALKLAVPGCKIIAFDKDGQALLLAKEEKTVDIVCTDVDDSFSSCDVFFLCTPVDFNAKYLSRIKAIRKPGSIITDVGSVKKTIHDEIRKLNLEDDFIGGHPMAGSERSGYSASRAGLLENAYYILTPTTSVSMDKVEFLSTIMKKAGSIPIIMSEDKHDTVTAAISHLPHMAAYALVNLIHDSDDPDHTMKLIAAGGFKDITRIASSSPIMWQQICGENKEKLLDFMDRYIAELSSLRSSIEKEDNGYLYDYFLNAKDYRNDFNDVISGPISRSYRLTVSIPDETGIIARLSGMFAENGINLKNMGIVHNREFEEGALRIEFYDESSLKEAILVLKETEYTIYTK